MTSFLTTAVILAAIMLGMVVIHLLNGQHAERIAAFRYQDPGAGGGTATRRRGARPATSSGRTTRSDAKPDADSRIDPRIDSRIEQPHSAVRRDPSLPEPGLAEVRVTAASPEVARQVANVLRASFASTEQRSYPAGDSRTGTRLLLTVDTAHALEPPRGSTPRLADRPPKRST